MKEWWLRLSIREQTIVMMGALFVFAIIYYFLIWAPVADSVDILQQNVAQDKELLSWMKITVPQIGTSNTSQYIAHPISEADLFGTVQQSLITSGIKSSLTNIEQQKEGTVKLSFQAVSFDNLVNWLIILHQSYGINPVEVSLDKLSEEGQVKGEIVLQSVQK